MADVSIRRLLDSDWESVRQIYIEGIASGNATFETQSPAWEPWNATARSMRVWPK